VITEEEAIKLGESGWWKGLPADVITGFQLFERKLCMDFGDFQGAVEESLGRPVWTHEFAGASVDALRDEFLGKSPKRSLADITALVSAQRIVVVTRD